jgi:cytochrome oxidase assembly protein ShyY1
MRRWRFAFERRWFTYLAMAVVFAIACALLSRWQFGRNQQVSAENQLVTANYSAPVVPIGSILSSKSSYSHADIYRRVAVEGTYLPSKQLLVRDRSLGSNPGFEVLTPLRMKDGSIFVVDRGWVSVGTKHDAPDYVPAAPAGHVRVVARLQGNEEVLPGRTAPSGEISEINLPTVARTLGESTTAGSATYTGAYGLLATETPAPANRPIAAPKPVIDNGPFLSYAFQWILFALFAFGGLFWALRQEYRIRNAADPEEQQRAAARERKARTREPTDADIEDAQIRDAQLAAADELIDAG